MDGNGADQTPTPRTGTPRASVWPAERHPTRWDVDEANHIPTLTVIDRFRSALMHGESEDIVSSSASWDLDSYLQGILADNDPLPYTYPMALFSAVPAFPSDAGLVDLGRTYLETFATHVYIKEAGEVTTDGVTTQLIPPYLQLARACLASVFSPQYGCTQGASETDSGHLFTAGVHAWAVMLEVDNREARNTKAVIAAALLSTYGVLASGAVVKHKTAGILCNVATITRRLRLTNACPSAYTSLSASERDPVGKSSATLCYMLLVDTLHALQSNTAPNYSISELSFCLPQSQSSFQTVYNAMLHGYAITNDLGHREDALALSVALLSNIIQTHISYFESLRHLLSSDPRNPYRPLSWKSELANAVAVFKNGLARWEECFLQRADHDVIALHHFSKMRLLVPNIAELPGLARRDLCQRYPGDEHERIPDEAFATAWEVFRHVECASKVDDQRISIWLPDILFMSALVLWQYHSAPQSGGKYGSLRSISMYQALLKQLPWPCCADMAAVLRAVETGR